MKESFDRNFLGVRIMRSFLAAILLCTVIGAFVVTWKPGPVERYFFPKNYWEKRAVELERGLKVDDVLLADARTELDKRLMSADLDEEATIELNKELALDPSIGKKNVEARMQELMDEIRRLKDKVARWQRQLEEDRRLLRQARVELAKFRRQPR
jgi:hypothetical protein